MASLEFAFGAIGPLGVWFILLSPEDHSSAPVLQSAWAFLTYVFTDAEASPAVRMHYILLTILPAQLLLLSVVTWRQATLMGPRRFWWIALGWVSTAIAIAIYWPSAIASAMATYHAGKRSAA